jgi:predicted transcriptional regulator
MQSYGFVDRSRNLKLVKNCVLIDDVQLICDYAARTVRNELNVTQTSFDITKLLISLLFKLIQPSAPQFKALRNILTAFFSLTLQIK